MTRDLWILAGIFAAIVYSNTIWEWVPDPSSPTGFRSVWR